MACAPPLGYFIGRCEAFTYLELSRKIGIFGKSI